MQTQANRRILEEQTLMTVEQLQAELPIEAVMASRVAGWTETVEQILLGEDPRLLVLAGPALSTAAWAH